MLRRYSSKNLDTIVLTNRRTTIGSGSRCDVVVKGNDIFPVHASIEATSSGFFLREHSLAGNTKVNDKRVFGQQEIRSGDMIQVGSNSSPFVFDSEWMFGTRPNSAKFQTATSGARTPTPVATTSTILPAIEKKVIHGPNHVVNSIPRNKRQESPARKRRSAEQSLRSSASSTESNRNYYGNGRSVGNNLLQRVVQLQTEIIARDEKIRQLTSIPPVPTQSHLYYQPSLPPPHTTAAPTALRPHPSPNSSAEQKTFELFAYRAFISAITSQLRQFNDRVLRTPQRDSAELFTAMCRAVDVPLSSRILDVEKHCEALLIDNDFEDGDELMSRLNNFLRESRREKILELTNELEMIMPLIRDAASNARENIKVCNVFTQWSRQFGNLLRKSSFSATTLFQAIEDLKTQFSDAHMSRHWLPPSITPILRLAALELEKRAGDVTPSVSPVPPIDRKKSIDMTLDTCISQVEAIVHEIDYHVVRLCNKARDYSTFQTLDLDSVIRISKVIESMKGSIEVLSEHSFKEDVRPNSVLFFEITNEDITSRKKSDSEGSQSSLKRVSVAPKIVDPLIENDEIVEERKEVEERMMEVVRGIGGVLEVTEEPIRNEGMISVDASVLKMLIQQSQSLLFSYQSVKTDEEVRRRRSIPPMITVQEEEEEEVNHLPEPQEASQSARESPEVVPEIAIEAPESVDAPEAVEATETPENSPPSPEAPEEVLTVEPVTAEAESSEEHPEDDFPDTPIPIRDSPDDVPLPEEVPLEEAPPRPKRNVDRDILKKSYSEDANFGRKRVTSSELPPDEPPIQESPLPESPVTPEEHEEDSDHLIDDDSEGDEEGEREEEDKEEDEEVSEDHNPFTDDDKSTVRYVPNAESQTTSHISPQDSLMTTGEIVVNGRQSRREEERITSHLRSHINTANGKPNITYQYPIRKYYSPPMKRRSKSEDQKIKETLSSRPPFVLY